jgi:hypothetical protein
VVRAPGYRSRDSGSITGTTREELLGKTSSGSGLKSREYGREDHATPSIRKSWSIVPRDSDINNARDSEDHQQFTRPSQSWSCTILIVLFRSPILFATCTSTFSKLYNNLYSGM